ncbi:MAG: amidohydrolase family protein [Chloroflexi bacterium]|nr:amidohydrolase family protein [Chloroflexota bacterium]
MDLILRNAQLHNGPQVDIAITGGRIAAIDAHLPTTAPTELDAGGRLTLPAFVNGQLHACKSFWRRLLAQLPAGMQTLPPFQAAVHVKRLYTPEEVFGRVDEVMQLAIRHGTCAIRLFADVDGDGGLAPVEGLLAIREKYSEWLTVQVVAFPQDGFAGPETERLMRRALEMGTDLVGGIPWIEAGSAAQQHHTERCFALAAEYDRDLHFVCDDTADPASRSLEMVARQTLAQGWQGRVAATQCAALAFYDDEHAARVIRLVAEAGMTILSNSHVSLIATEIPDRQPWPRGVTRVRELLDAGVPVVCGQDDIDNWFYPFGRNDLLEVAQFMAHNGRFAWHGEVERVLPMVTSTPARLLGLDEYGLAVGAPANLVVLDAPDWHQAIQFQAEKRFVILRGKVAAETERIVKSDLP